MVDFIFEGEVKVLSAIQQAFVKNVLKELGINNEKVTIEAVGKPGDNYIADVKRIVAKKDDKILKMIAKIAPNQEQVRRAMNTAVCFSNENIMYSKVLPKFTQLEKDANISFEDRLKYAKFYGSLMDKPHEIILIEDLAESDFVMLDRFNTLKDDNIKLVLKNFAKLHAASYALKNLEPETFECFSNKLLNLWELVGNTPERDQSVKELIIDVINLMDEEKYYKIVDQIMNNVMEECVSVAKADRGKSVSVIQQGDPWTNNILFKLDGDKSIDCCMIDYQVSKESSPVADITYLIFNCTDVATRSKHYHDWINYYYSELKIFLNYYGLDIDSTYPRDQLEKDLRRYAKYSLGQAIMMASCTVRESKDAGTFKLTDDNESMEELLKSNKLTLLDETTLQKFKNKVIDLVDTFLELGYIEEQSL